MKRNMLNAESYRGLSLLRNMLNPESFRELSLLHYNKEDEHVES
jgi:hypothetical protein